jgi:hypothetical protein
MQAEIHPSLYKINRIVNNSIASIHVFYGEKSEDVRDLEELFQKDPENILFSNIFNPFELNNIRTNNIPVFFSKFQLHYDDNIENHNREDAEWVRLMVLDAEGKLKYDSENDIFIELE